MSFEYSGKLEPEKIKSRAKELARKLEYEYSDINNLCEALYCKKIEGSKFNYANSAIALVGDNVLKLALSHKFYSSGVDKKTINKKKEAYENNKQLKKVCDKLEIYKYAFNDDDFYSDDLPDNKKLPRPQHDPYVEAVIGAIYLDKDFDYANEWINYQLIPLIELMNEVLTFADREQFRKWLNENCTSSEGVWLLFGKNGGPKTLKADEALEEALCFGWIDGQMQRIDGNTYKKYFALRRANSKWSDKNKALVKSLEERGLMTDFGREKIEEAKKNGQWDATDLMSLGEEAIDFLADLLKEYETAYANFKAMPQSVKKTYARAYFDAKTDAGKNKRLAWIVDRLNRNLRPV